MAKPIDEDEVNTFVAFTRDEGSSSEPLNLEPDSHWIAIRPVHKDVIATLPDDNEITGHIVFVESHNLDRASTLAFLQFAIDAIESGVKITHEDLFGDESEEDTASGE